MPSCILGTNTKKFFAMGDLLRECKWQCCRFSYQPEITNVCCWTISGRGKSVFPSYNRMKRIWLSQSSVTNWAVAFVLSPVCFLQLLKSGGVPVYRTNRGKWNCQTRKETKLTFLATAMSSCFPLQQRGLDKHQAGLSTEFRKVVLVNRWKG